MDCKFCNKPTENKFNKVCRLCFNKLKRFCLSFLQSCNSCDTNSTNTIDDCLRCNMAVVESESSFRKLMQHARMCVVCRIIGSSYCKADADAGLKWNATVQDLSMVGYELVIPSKSRICARHLADFNMGDFCKKCVFKHKNDIYWSMKPGHSCFKFKNFEVCFEHLFKCVQCEELSEHRYCSEHKENKVCLDCTEITCKCTIECQSCFAAIKKNRSYYGTKPRCINCRNS